MTISKLENSLVAVLRGKNEYNMHFLVESLLKGGITNIEITLDTPDAFNVIKSIKKEFNNQILIGAGTVLDPTSAILAINAGAEFVVSPTLNTDVIKATKRHGKISIPGALTPSEVLNAYECGADVVKVFPAGSLGPNYIKDLKGPLSYIQVMPTGGIGIEDVVDYFNAGAFTVGLGSSLIRHDLILEKKYNEISQLAKSYVDKISMVNR
ncbi:bifunctional 4-hydroxy-2-oxoglutarate aldolase/2-dehydro-3-deoxy-phosphogluconate aldolase [Alkalihalobacterium sp. APHAB7]|uniref:bifunctional 4-hydroxy-2-oxoglutarate aldolase/2-dehydro-3-deoxy-phosphogluconate aldolase n=1 Tax=Alkalihalobacterium sp. APHAB7 TaxID=3402081 RepID=UPI003AB0B11B